MINCHAYTNTSSNSDAIHNSSIQVSIIKKLIQYVGQGNISDILPLYTDSVSYTFSNGSSFHGNKFEWIEFLQKNIKRGIKNTSKKPLFSHKKEV